MKKYNTLSKNIAFLLFIVATVLSSYNQLAYSLTKEEYYKKRLFPLTNAGYRVVTTSSLLSQQPDIDDSFFDKVSYVIVCDADYELNNGFGCGYYGIKTAQNVGQDFEVIKIQKDDKKNLPIHLLKINGHYSITYLIPEIYFVTPSFSVDLTEYISSLSKLKNYTAETEEGRVTKQLSVELALLVVVWALILLSLILTPSALLNSKSSRVTSQTRLLATILFIIILVLYTFISLPDQKTLYVSAKEIYSALKAYITSSLVVETGLISSSAISVVILALLTKNLIKRGLLADFRYKLHSLLRVVFPVGASVILITAIGNFSAHIVNAIFGALTLLILFSYLYPQESPDKNSYTKKERAVIAVIVIFCILTGLAIRGKGIMPNYREKRAYLADTSINKYPAFTLPKNVKLKNSTKVEDFVVGVENDVFVNNILVNSKYGHTKIINEPIKSLTNENKNATLISTGHDNYITGLCTNSIFEKLVTTSAPSNIFRFIDTPNSTDNVSFEIELNCTGGLDSSTLSIVEYSNFSRNPTLNPRTDKLMFFPGCVPGKPAKYVVPFDFSSSRPASSIFEIVGIPSNSLTNIRFVYEDKDVKVKFYTNPEWNVFVADGRSYNRKESDLTVYSTDLINSVVIERETDKINIGEVVNRLFRNNQIKNTVTIWSPDISILVKLVK